MPICLAGRRSATAALVQICVCDLNVAIDPRGLRQIPVSAAYQSCAATSSAIALVGVGRRHTALPSANPHSARGTVACHFPRLRSLKAFGRRPRCKPRRRHGPASETLNIHDIFRHVRFAPKSDQGTDIPKSTLSANAQNRCAIARCAGSPTASAVTGGKIVDSGRGVLS